MNKLKLVDSTRRVRNDSFRRLSRRIAMPSHEIKDEEDMRIESGQESEVTKVFLNFSRKSMLT